jgi:hypothetical protein
MAKKPLKDFPIDKPASPDPLAGREGAAPSSSGDGPSGRGAAGRAAPRNFYERKRKFAALLGRYYSGGLEATTTPEGFFDPFGKTYLSHADLRDLLQGGAPSPHRRDRAWQETVESFACGCTKNIDRFATYEPGDLPTAEEYDALAFETGRLVERPPKSDCVACAGSGRIRDRRVRRQARIITAEEHELRERGGYTIEKAGPTGNEPGRPKRGVRDSDTIYQELVRGLQDERARSLMAADIEAAKDGATIPYKNLRAPLEIAIYLSPKLNVAAAAATFGLSKETVHRMKKRGEKLTQNSPNSGGTKNVRAIQPVIHRCAFCPEWSANNLEEQTEHILTVHGISNRRQPTNVATRADIADLREQMRVEHEELVRLLFAFRFGETPIEAWERLLQEAA